MLLPMFAFVVFIYLFLLLNFIFRVRSVKSHAVKIGYYRLFSGDQQIPRHILAGQKHFANLFETPVLFFVVGILAIVLKVETPLMIGLAWSYVGIRIVHAFIHSTYNNVVHRMLVFWASILALFAMWLHLVISTY